MERITIIKQGQIIDKKWLFEVNVLISKIDDKLKQNYLNMDFDNHLQFDILIEDGEIVTWGGLYHRPSWPNNHYRVSNRVYVNPKFRAQSYEFLNPIHIGPYQIQECLLDTDVVFISREKPKARYYFKKLQRLEYYKEWQISEKMLHLVPQSQYQSAYQYVLFKGDINIPGISEEEWNKTR